MPRLRLGFQYLVTGCRIVPQPSQLQACVSCSGLIDVLCKVMIQPRGVTGHLMMPGTEIESVAVHRGERSHN